MNKLILILLSNLLFQVPAIASASSENATAHFNAIWGKANKKFERLKNSKNSHYSFIYNDETGWTQLEQYYRKAAVVYESHLKALMFGIQTQCPGAMLIFPDLKDPIRAVDKVASKYMGNIDLLKDVVRGTIVFESLTNTDVKQLLETLESGKNAELEYGTKKFRITRIKDRTAPNERTKDILFNAEVTLEDGSVFPLEVQLASPDSVILNTYSHYLYMQIRVVEQKKEAEQAPKKKEALGKKLNKLEQHFQYIQKEAERLIAEAKGRPDNKTMTEEHFMQLQKKRKRKNSA